MPGERDIIRLDEPTTRSASRRRERITRTLYDNQYPSAAVAFDTKVKLTTADAAPGHRIGWSVSTSGDTNDRNLVALRLPVHHPFVVKLVALSPDGEESGDDTQLLAQLFSFEHRTGGAFAHNPEPYC